jgi:signal transduction histidine kinase
LAQTTAGLLGSATTSDTLTGIARHAVDGTEGLACDIVVVNDEHEARVARASPAPDAALGVHSPAAESLPSDLGEHILQEMTQTAIRFGDAPGKPVVEADARLVWEANPAVRDFALTLRDLDWLGAVYVPLSWENRTFGFMCVYLPTGVAGPTETELAFYTALADQAAVAIINGRLTAQAAEAGSLLERSRLAREMHDSVSQALFSMTMHARAAQLLVTRTGVDETGPLARSLAQLVELTRGALAEMRALIFELRPGALAEEGMIAALRKQAAVFADREQITIAIDGPDQRLELEPKVEEHFYRIVSEALHNVIKHAQARHATVTVTVADDAVQAVVDDDGIGFDPASSHPGHLGLRTMQQRAETIGAHLNVTSTPHTGTTITITTLAYPSAR